MLVVGSRVFQDYFKKYIYLDYALIIKKQKPLYLKVEFLRKKMQVGKTMLILHLNKIKIRILHKDPYVNLYQVGKT